MSCLEIAEKIQDDGKNFLYSNFNLERIISKSESTGRKTKSKALTKRQIDDIVNSKKAYLETLAKEWMVSKSWEGMYFLDDSEYFPYKARLAKKVLDGGYKNVDELKSKNGELFGEIRELTVDKNLIQWASKHYNQHSIPTAEIVCSRLKSVTYKYMMRDRRIINKTLDSLLTDQASTLRCIVCFASFIKYIPNEGFKHLQWIVEHEHQYKKDTGRLRGKVCTSCNVFLGYVDAILDNNNSVVSLLNLDSFTERALRFKIHFNKDFLKHLISEGFIKEKQFKSRKDLFEKLEWLNYSFDKKKEKGYKTTANALANKYKIPIQLFTKNEVTGPDLEIEIGKKKKIEFTGKVVTIEDVIRKSRNLTFKLDDLVVNDMSVPYSLLKSVYDQLFNTKLKRQTLKQFITDLVTFVKTEKLKHVGNKTIRQILDRDRKNKQYKNWETHLLEPISNNTFYDRITLTALAEWKGVVIVCQTENLEMYRKQFKVELGFGNSVHIAERYKAFIPGGIVKDVNNDREFEFDEEFVKEFEEEYNQSFYDVEKQIFYGGSISNNFAGLPVTSELSWKIFLKSVFINRLPNGHYDSLVIEFPKNLFEDRFSFVQGFEISVRVFLEEELENEVLTEVDYKEMTDTIEHIDEETGEKRMIELYSEVPEEWIERPRKSTAATKFYLDDGRFKRPPREEDSLVGIQSLFKRRK